MFIPMSREVCLERWSCFPSLLIMAYPDIVNWFYVGMTYFNNTYLLNTDVTHMYLENVITFFLFKSLSSNKTAINV